MNDALIFDAVRSPRAKARADGALHSLTPQALLKQLYKALEQRSVLDPRALDEVILGCVTQHGEQAANIARTSLLYAGWPESLPGLTVHRFCSSSVDAIALAAMKVNVGAARLLVAGGVEMMSRVPMLSDAARIFLDPEFAQRSKTLMMGSGADLIASLHGISREALDSVALRSQQRSAHARASGYFSRSLVPINTDSGIADRDECIRESTTMESLASLPPAFATIGAKGADEFQMAQHPQLAAIDHLHTAGNSPAMADAAATVLIGSAEMACELASSPRARIAASVTVATDTSQVLTGCIAATDTLLEQSGLTATDVDLFEIHEAFAAVSVVAQRRFDPEGSRLNVNGGVIALGHPMGATGAIMTMTLLEELERRGLRRGIVAAAGAAGSGSALLIDRELAD